MSWLSFSAQQINLQIILYFLIFYHFCWYYFAQFEECWRSWLSSAGQFSLEVSHAVLVCGVRVSSKLFFTHGLSGGGWLSTRMSVELFLENRAWTNGLFKLPGGSSQLSGWISRERVLHHANFYVLVLEVVGLMHFICLRVAKDWPNSWGAEITSIFLKEDQKTYGHTLQPPLI